MMFLRSAAVLLACIAAPAFGTIVDLAVATDSLSTLVTAVQAADLVDALSDPDATLTVFAPTNDAFGLLPAGLLDALLTPGFNMHLKEILTYHVYGVAAVPSSALVDGQVISPMLNTGEVTIGIDGAVVTVNEVNISAPDNVDSNGIAHIIDAVLVPPSIGATVTALGSDYSTVLSLVTLADLDSVLNGAGPFTFFAPQNAAFALLPAATVAFLQTADGKSLLTTILTYHVVSGSVTSDLLTAGEVPTVQGLPVTIDLMDGVMVNDATVVEANILALNGVAHGINRVLIPVDDSTMAPTMSPSAAASFGASSLALLVGAAALL